MTPLIAQGHPPEHLVNQPFYVKRYDGGPGPSPYYEIIWGDGARAIPLGMKFHIIAVRQ